MLRAAGGLCMMAPARKSLQKNMARVQARPIARKLRQATVKVRRACMTRPSALASEIIRDRAMGRPAVDRVRNTLYTLYVTRNREYPSSPMMLAMGTL